MSFVITIMQPFVLVFAYFSAVYKPSWQPPQVQQKVKWLWSFKSSQLWLSFSPQFYTQTWHALPEIQQMSALAFRIDNRLHKVSDLSQVL